MFTMTLRVFGFAIVLNVKDGRQADGKFRVWERNGSVSQFSTYQDARDYADRMPGSVLTH
jgi:hypothetical protein